MDDDFGIDKYSDSLWDAHYDILWKIFSVKFGYNNGRFFCPNCKSRRGCSSKFGRWNALYCNHCKKPTTAFSVTPLSNSKIPVSVPVLCWHILENYQKVKNTLIQEFFNVNSVTVSRLRRTASDISKSDFWFQLICHDVCKDWDSFISCEMLKKGYTKKNG